MVMITADSKDRKGSEKVNKRPRVGFLIHTLDYFLVFSGLRLDLFFGDFGNET